MQTDTRKSAYKCPAELDCSQVLGASGPRSRITQGAQTFTEEWAFVSAVTQANRKECIGESFNPSLIYQLSFFCCKWHQNRQGTEVGGAGSITTSCE